MKYYVLAMVGIVILIVCVVIKKRKQIETKKYYDAAEQIVKEEYLSSVLRNKIDNNYQSTIPMLYLKLYKPKPIQGYVFNPQNNVTIGRDKKNCSIWIHSGTVSMRHCSISVWEDGNVYLSDSNSKNGTVIKKGFHKYWIGDGMSILLESGDKIYIEDTAFKVTIFYFSAFY